LAIFGSTHTSSINALQTFTNSYNIPYISWSSPLLAYKNTNVSKNFQIYMSPDLSAVIVAILKHYKWEKIFYIYNHEEGLFENLF
jgi:hypothetical protein